MADETKPDEKIDFTGMKLKQKIVAIRGKMHNIEKTGHNEHFNYDFVEAGVLMGKIGSRLAEAGIIIGRRNLIASRSMEEKGAIVSLQCEYGLIDADSGDELWYASYGEGQDKSDKAAYKAWTGMFKYFLMQAFALAMGDDPEAEDVGEDTGAARRTPQNGSNARERASTIDGPIASSGQLRLLDITAERKKGRNWSSWLEQRLEQAGTTRATVPVKIFQMILNELADSGSDDQPLPPEDDPFA